MTSSTAREDAPEHATSPLSSPAESPDVSPAGSPAIERPHSHIPSLRSISDPASTASLSSSSSPIGLLQNARRPIGPANSNQRTPQASVAALPQSMEAKMRAFQLSRQGTPPRPPMATSASTGRAPDNPAFGGTGLAANLRLPPNLRPQPHNFVSAPAVPHTTAPKGGLSERRRMKLPGGLPGGLPGSTPPPSGANPTLPNANGTSSNKGGQPESMFDKFSDYVDTKTGTLKFKDKAVIHGHGIDFSSGSNFSISLDEVDTLEELGKGNYGTVYKVRHARPRIRRPGLGLAGNRAPSNLDKPDEPPAPQKGTTGVIMAMKEIRLELDESKFAAIIMELDILHRCVSPYIIEFYGAFFQEGAVYICIEFMDGGSIDKIYGDGIPESVLRKITFATTQGLKSLKDDHNIIHRDVKPTNILVNTRGQVKICDFGVSGNLVASIAKTNIGCQSYMAPERIAGGGMAQAGASGGTYSVQSDIWSLGLSVIECAMGRYPYPPETYNNIFSQLSAIVDGDPPDLPSEGYSPLARDFVRGCLNKIPKLRPTYSMLLQHGWLAPLSKPAAISEDDEEDETAEDGAKRKPKVVGQGGTDDDEVAEWVKEALDRKKRGLLGVKAKPALHAVSLDGLSPKGGS